jgi:signal recognition particle subunit SRP54
MVLNELGKRINAAMRSFVDSPLVSQKELDHLIKDICAALLESDVNVKLVQNLRKNIKASIPLDQLGAGINKRKLVQKAVLDELVNLVDPRVEPYKPTKGKSNVFMFVGLQGSGKTTTCTKLAAHYQRKGWKVGLVCADTFRAGAFDQLKQNAAKIKIPFYGSYTETDPTKIAEQGVTAFKKDRFEIIIVDTSGRHKQEADLFEEMKQIEQAVHPDQVIFILDGTIGQAAEAQATAFKDTVDVGALVITKMDGHSKGGGAISAVAATQSPIIFIGTGEHAHDLERFSPRSFISKMLGMGDISGLMETVQDLKLDQNTNLIKKLEKGEFSLRDMYEQFQMIQKMGPLGKIMGMMPGFPPEMLGATEQEGTKRIKKMQVIMDSMNNHELDSDGKLFELQPTRIDRIAKGAGVPGYEVQLLLVQYKQFAHVVKKMGGPKGLMKTMADAGKKKSTGGQVPNARLMQQQMSKLLPPGMVQQMGGMGNIQEMARKMMGGGGGMQEMMANMMGGGGGGGGGMGGMQEMMASMMGGSGSSPFAGASPQPQPRKKKR